MNKIIKFLKNCPVFIGSILLIILVLVILIYRKNQENEIFDPQFISEDLQRENTLDGFADPKELIKYLSAAVEEQDEDKFLRGCAIDELSLQMDVTKLINYEGTFSIHTPMPAKAYRTYFPITSCEITDYYNNIYEIVKNQLDGSIVEIDYVRPADQLKDDYKITMQEQAEIIGAYAICEVYGLYRKDGYNYLMGFTLGQYYGYWKMLSATSELAGMEEEGNIESDETRIEQLKGSENEGNKLSKYLQSFVDEDAKIEKEKYTEEALLPANYFWVAPHYGKTAQEAVEKFILYIQKDDISSAMSFGSRLDEFLNQENTDNSEILKEQGIFAGQIKNLYLGLLGVKADEDNISLEELGMTADKLVSKLTPQDIHYMELVGTKEVESKDDQAEILAVLKYSAKYYLAGFTLKHTENGWYIDSLSSESENIMNGEIKKITQDRSDTLLS